MGSVWCVQPESVTVNLAWRNGDKELSFWIKLRKRLTVGESRAMMTSGWGGVGNLGRRTREGVQDPEVKIDWKVTAFARAAAYLLDWSLEDDDHKRLKVSVEQVEQLHPDVFDLIEGAITAHVEAMDSEKKVTPGDIATSATSV